MMRFVAEESRGWGTSAWPDVLAFALGLGLAWWAGWMASDLVWSLWLSSLVLGTSLIVRGAFAPASLRFGEGDMGAFLLALAHGVATLFFFTLHFGLFHAAQAAMLNDFLPFGGVEHQFNGEAALELLQRYGWFLPAMIISERHAWVLPKLPPEPPRTSVKASDIEVRKARQSHGSMQLALPYLKVIKMHLLIFLLAVVHFVETENFAVYTIVYVLYFFPWRLLQRRAPATGASGA